MRKALIISFFALAAAATSSAQNRDYTVTWPTAKEAALLEAFAKAYPVGITTTLADASTAVLEYGLTVCVPASAADLEAGVCVPRATTTVERRTILRKALRAFMRDHYRAKVIGDAGDAARATATTTVDADVPVEAP